MVRNKVAGLQQRVRRMLTSMHMTDDFDWSRYTPHYREQGEETERVHTLMLKAGDYVFQRNRLEVRRDILPLHPNYQLLYETVLQLKPSSVAEIGCGSGDHLHNLAVLCSNIELLGIDRSAQQIGFLHMRHPGIAANVMRIDATVPHSIQTVCDLAYTQAVVMHIQTKRNHLVALENLFRCARRQVILVENWTRHAFMEDIQGLYEGGRIPWTDLYAHYRVSETNPATRIMVLSTASLPNYPALTDYATQLRAYAER